MSMTLKDRKKVGVFPECTKLVDNLWQWINKNKSDSIWKTFFLLLHNNNNRVTEKDVSNT